MSDTAPTLLLRLAAALGRSPETDRAALEQIVDLGRVRCAGCRAEVGLGRFIVEQPVCPACGAALAAAGSALPLEPGRELDARTRVLPARGEPSAEPTPVPCEEGAAPPAPTPEIGRAFGKYRIEAEISRGGMGVVYRAHDPKLNRTVAIKLLLAGGHASAQQIERFQREAKAAARLHHPNLVPIHEVGVQDGLHYLTMDFIRGIPLDQLLQERRVLPPIEALKIVRDAAYALHYAHHHGIIHRDIKPGNIILAFDEPMIEAAMLRESDRTRSRRFLPPFRAMITDFGLAKELGGPVSNLTESGIAMGTPHYMSPEQAKGEYEKLDGRTDIYALGVVLYEMLTGQKPLDASSVVELLMLVVDHEPPTPRQVNPALSVAVSTICQRAMAKNRSARYQTALELAQDAESCLAGEEIAARPFGFLYYAVGAVRRNTAQALSAAASAAVVLGVVAWFAWVDPWLTARRARLAQEALQATQARWAEEKTELARIVLEEAEQSLLAGRPEAAAPVLAAAASQYSDTPFGPALHYRWGEALAASGNSASAMDVLAGSIALGAGAEWEDRAWLLIARLLVESGRAREALPTLHRLFGDHPELRTDPAALTALARAHLGALDLDGAARVYARARQAAGAAVPPAVEDGEGFCRALGVVSRIDGPGLPLAAAALPGDRSAPARLFVGGTQGLVEVRGEPSGPPDEFGPATLAARAVSADFAGPVAALAAVAMPAPRLFALEWRGSAEMGTLHVFDATGRDLRLLQRIPVLPVAGPAGVRLLVADLDGDRGLELVLAAEAGGQKLQAWRARAGEFIPWQPRFVPDRLDPPILHAAVLEGPGNWPRLFLCSTSSGRIRAEQWQWDRRDQAFLLRRHGVATRAARAVPFGPPNYVVLAIPDGPEALGRRTMDPESRAGVAWARVQDGTVEMLGAERISPVDPESQAAPAVVVARLPGGERLVLARWCPSQAREHSLWVLRIGEPGAQATCLKLRFAGTESAPWCEAVDLDGDGADEALVRIRGSLLLLGRPGWRSKWPAPPAARMPGWLASSGTEAAPREAGGTVPPGRPPGTRQARLSAALELARIGLVGPAARLLESLANEEQSAPGAAVPWSALGALHEQEGQSRAALAAFDRALRVGDVAPPETIFARARGLCRTGESAAAARDLRDVLARALLPEALRRAAARWLEEAEADQRAAPVVEDRFESAAGPLRLTAVAPWEWERDRYLLRLRQAHSVEHAAYFAGQLATRGWALEGEWQESPRPGAAGYAFGCWQGPSAEAPTRGCRVRVFQREGAVQPEAFVVLEGGPGFGVTRTAQVALPSREWLRFVLRYHSAEGRAELRIATRAGVEVVALDLHGVVALPAGPTFAGLFVERTPFLRAGVPEVDLSGLRFTADPAGWREPSAEQETAGGLGHRANRLAACRESAEAARAYEAAAGQGELPADVALARIVAAWGSQPETAAQLLRRHAQARPLALGRAIERALPGLEERVQRFLLAAWPDVEEGESDLLAAAAEGLASGRRFEALAACAAVVGRAPALALRAANVRGWALAQLGDAAGAVREWTGALQSPAADPAVVDSALRGLVALDAGAPGGAIGVFLRKQGAHVQAVAADVLPGGAAAGAGLLPGDVVETVDGVPVESALDALGRLVARTADRPAKLGVARGAERREAEVRAGPLGLRLVDRWGLAGK